MSQFKASALGAAATDFSVNQFSASNRFGFSSFILWFFVFHWYPNGFFYFYYQNIAIHSIKLWFCHLQKFKLSFNHDELSLNHPIWIITLNYFLQHFQLFFFIFKNIITHKYFDTLLVRHSSKKRSSFHIFLAIDYLFANWLFTFSHQSKTWWILSLLIWVEDLRLMKIFIFCQLRLWLADQAAYLLHWTEWIWNSKRISTIWLVKNISTKSPDWKYFRTLTFCANWFNRHVDEIFPCMKTLHTVMLSVYIYIHGWKNLFSKQWFAN